MNNFKRSFFIGLSILIFSILVANAQELKKEEKIDNIKNLHNNNENLSVKQLFKGKEGITRSLQLKKDALLKEHITKIEALLICISGEALYEDEKGNKKSLKIGDYIIIEPMVKHWVKATEDSQLLLIK